MLKIFQMEPNERVLLKSIELFTKYGIRLVTMDQIADEVGMSKRTIYELFKDKDTLVKFCLEEMFRMQIQETQEILAKTSNVIEALHRMGIYREKKLASVNFLFYEDIRKLYPHLWEQMKRFAKSGADSLNRKILTKGIKEGIFKKELKVEIIDIFITSMMEIFHKKDTFPENTSDEDLIRNIIVPYYLGISTEKGKQLIEQYLTATPS